VSGRRYGSPVFVQRLPSQTGAVAGRTLAQRLRASGYPYRPFYGRSACKTLDALQQERIATVHKMCLCASSKIYFTVSTFSVVIGALKLARAVCSVRSWS
jgi:hypothetical protein